MQQDTTSVATNTMGTLTHAAPELLLEGRFSKRMDVYAFGIMMWEIMTGKALYSEMSQGEIVTQITLNKLRPTFPDYAPKEFIALAKRCWDHEPDARPKFDEISQTILNMVKEYEAQEAAALQRTGSNDSNLELPPPPGA